MRKRAAVGGLVAVVLIAGIAQSVMFWSHYGNIPSFPASAPVLKWEADEAHARLMLNDSTAMEFARLGQGAAGATLRLGANE
jgi:hypothetical protein